MRAEFALIREWPILLVGAALICAALALAVSSLASERRRGTVAGGEPDEAVPGVRKPGPAGAFGTPSPPPGLGHPEDQLPPLTLADSALTLPDTPWGDETRGMAAQPVSGPAGGPASPRAAWAGGTPTVAPPPMSPAVWADDPWSGVAPDMGAGPVSPSARPGTAPSVPTATGAADSPEAPWGGEAPDMTAAVLPAAAVRAPLAETAWAAESPAIAAPAVLGADWADAPWGETTDMTPPPVLASTGASDLPHAPWGDEAPDMALPPAVTATGAADLPDAPWGDEAPDMAYPSDPTATAGPAVADVPPDDETPDTGPPSEPKATGGPAVVDAPRGGETPEMAPPPVHTAWADAAWASEVSDAAALPGPNGQAEIRPAPSSRRAPRTHHQPNRRRDHDGDR
jgi:hypothetical protein